MTTEPTLPTHPVDADLASVDGTWVLTFERILRHPIESVWSTITDAEQTRHWAPFAPSRNLDGVGAVALTVLDEADDTESVTDGTIVTCAPPGLLVLLWGDDELHFTLEREGEGTRLIFTHTFTAREEAPSYAAGWHLCLAALIGTVGGLEVPPVAGRAALDQGWHDLFDRYGDLFGS